MQKRALIYLSFLSAGCLFSFSDVFAGVQFLPRYQGSYGLRSQVGGRKPIEISCAPEGVEKRANQTCSGAFNKGGKLCYEECRCMEGYKLNTAGDCVSKTCEDYSLASKEDEMRQCTIVSQKPNLQCYECEDCDSNIYEYKCSGGLNKPEQGKEYKCGESYSKCICVENAEWNETEGRCVCKSDYIEKEGQCLLKECKDYNEEYQTEADTEKDCTETKPRADLVCWDCRYCDPTYKYECTPSSSSHIKGGKGEACGGKYTECECDNTLYSWDNGVCTLNCTRNSCSEIDYPLLNMNAENAAGYEECVPSCSDEDNRYRISSCNVGYELVNGACVCLNQCSMSTCPTGTLCEKEECSGKYCAIGCEAGYTTTSSYIYLFYLL